MDSGALVSTPARIVDGISASLFLSEARSSPSFYSVSAVGRVSSDPTGIWLSRERKFISVSILFLL